MNDSQRDRSEQLPTEPGRAWTAPTYQLHGVQIESGSLSIQRE